LEKTFKIIESTVNLTLPSLPLNHVPKHHIYTSFMCSDLLVQIIDKDTKQKWPQYWALGNTSCDWPPTGFNSIHHNSLGPAIQPVFYPVKSAPV